MLQNASENLIRSINKMEILEYLVFILNCSVSKYTWLYFTTAVLQNS